MNFRKYEGTVHKIPQDIKTIWKRAEEIAMIVLKGNKRRIFGVYEDF